MLYYSYLKSTLQGNSCWMPRPWAVPYVADVKMGREIVYKWADQPKKDWAIIRILIVYFIHDLDSSMKPLMKPNSLVIMVQHRYSPLISQALWQISKHFDCSLKQRYPAPPWCFFFIFHVRQSRVPSDCSTVYIAQRLSNLQWNPARSLKMPDAFMRWGQRVNM